ncbi:MAG: hypothetical protein ACK58L_03235, partial [Planctomycetota bacterium]
STNPNALSRSVPRVCSTAVFVTCRQILQAQALEGGVSELVPVRQTAQKSNGNGSKRNIVVPTLKSASPTQVVGTWISFPSSSRAQRLNPVR